MGAIFGIFGDGHIKEAEQIADSLGHRGDTSRIWTVSNNLIFGINYFQKEGKERSRSSDQVLFDGHIDNKKSLLRLVGLGRNIEINEDELVLRLFKKFGGEGFGYISGNFSVAIWDERKKSLLMSCDSWTSKPIYYAQNNGRYIFASEYKALLAIDSIPAIADRQAIQYIQCTKYVMPERTCLKDVNALAGGTWIEIEGFKKEIFRYQDLKINIENRSVEDHSISIRKSFLDSVQKQTESYPVIGISLSSGLDSTITISAVRNLFPERKIHAFTAGISEDDSVFEEAGEVASFYNAKHHKIIFNPDSLPKIIPECIWHMEDPVGREEKLFYYITAREAAKYVQVLLAGHNADALFGGMPRHIIVKLNNKLPIFKRPLDDFYNFTQYGQQPKSILGKAITAAYFRGKNIAPPQVIGSGHFPEGDSIVRRSNQPLNQFLKEVQLYSSNANLTIDKIHAAFNLVFKSPFLDTDFVRSSFEIPDHLKIFRLKQKYILRRAFKGIMPEEMVERKKGLLRLEHSRKFCDVIYQLTQKYLSSNDIKKRNLFSNDYIQNVVKMPKSGIYSTEQIYRIWSILFVEIWARIYLDARGNKENMPNYL